jgi:hypothetical protein
MIDQYTNNPGQDCITYSSPTGSGRPGSLGPAMGVQFADLTAQQETYRVG